MWTHDGYYRQKDGLAMGAPPAPPLANIWMSIHDPHIRANAKLYRRYVDDIIMSIKKDLIQSKLQEINDLHGNLKFTFEMEKDGKLPFLDMMILHSGNRLESMWYCKPSDTGLVLNYHALAPNKYKRSVVEGFVYRIFRSCSSWHYFHESLQIAKQSLNKNQYPESFYDPIIEKTLEKLTTLKENNPQEQVMAPHQQLNNTSHLVFIQYRGAPSQAFLKKLKNSGARVQPVITMRKMKTTLPSLKAPVPIHLQSRVVYRITCPSCSACYVGQTARHVCTRFGEHKTKTKQAVRAHFDRCGAGRPDMTQLDILTYTTRSVEYLEALEALYIEELKPQVNTKDEYRMRTLTIKIF